MSSTGVRESNDTNKRVIKGLILNEAQFIQSLRVFANTSTLSGLGATGTETNNSPLEASGNYLAKSGDIMIGQLGNAFDTITATNIVNDILDVSKATGTTFPIVILQGESPPTADDLVTITQGEDVFSFQELVIRTRSSIITVKNSDNINTPDGSDLVLPVGSIIHLYFDTFLGEWVIDSGTPFFSGGGGEFFGPWTANHDAGNFGLNNVSSIQISDSVGGIHSLLQGLAGVGTRLTLTAGEKFQIFDNITQLLEIDTASGFNVFGNSINNILSLDIEDSAGATKLGISGPFGVGARFSFISGDSVFFTENITNRLEINALGISLLGGDITMGSGGNIVGGGAGEGMTNIGHLDFIDNLATPAAAVSLYSDGTDMLVNTGGGVVNLSDVGGGVFLDSTFRIQGSGDQTKQLAFEVDTFTTATTRTFGWPDADGTVFITPAQEDLDLNTFDIFDIDKLAFMNFASTGSSLNIGFSALGSGGFRANVLNNGDFEITEENILHFSFDGGLNSINVIDSLFNILETVGSTAYQISKSNGETILNEPTKIQQQIAGADIFDIQSGGITMADNKVISNVDQIGFRVLGNFIEDDASGMRYISVPGDQHLFGDGTNIFATLDVEGLFLNQLFIQFTSIASPGVTGSPNVGELFMDSGNSDHLSIIRNSSVIDLEAGGGATLDGVQEFEIPTTDLDIDGDVQEIFITNGKQGYEVSKSTTITEDIVVYLPVYVAQRSRVTDLGWNNLETGAGTITFAMALYDNIGGGVNYPGDLIVQDTSSTVTGIVQAARTNSLTPTNIEAGLYWIALLPTNMQVGVIASCSRHDTAGANSAGYFDDEGNTDVFLSILGFTGGEVSLPSTADSAMAAIVENPPAVFMRLIPNTS